MTAREDFDRLVFLEILHAVPAKLDLPSLLLENLGPNPARGLQILNQRLPHPFLLRFPTPKKQLFGHQRQIRLRVLFQVRKLELDTLRDLRGLRTFERFLPDHLRRELRRFSHIREIAFFNFLLLFRPFSRDSPLPTEARDFLLQQRLHYDPCAWLLELFDFEPPPGLIQDLVEVPDRFHRLRAAGPQRGVFLDLSDQLVPHGDPRHLSELLQF